MSKQHHYLKTVESYWDDVYNGLKRFEIRENDRDFKLGDMIYLQRYDQFNKIFTGGVIIGEITYICADVRFNKEGYCTFGFEVIE